MDRRLADGETWRVEPELALEPTDEPYLCGRYTFDYRRGDCHRQAVAVVRNSKGYVTLAVCSRHLAEFGAWIEDSRVVSWALRRG